MIDKIIAIAKDAGKILLKYYNGDFEISEKTGPEDIVTSADFESDKFIRTKLKENFPDDKIISEETASDITDFSGNVWVADPLDGTMRFSQKKEGFCVIIGLCKDGKPTLGVVYDPINDITYYAESGKGAFMIISEKKSRLKVNDKSEFENANSIIVMNIGQKLNVNVKNIIQGHSAGLKTMAVASGEVDFYFEGTVRASKWDTCAPQIILEEAGGVISGISGEQLDYTISETRWPEAFLASNGVIHKAASREINKALNH